jgi:hypothetical protein
MNLPLSIAGSPMLALLIYIYIYIYDVWQHTSAYVSMNLPLSIAGSPMLALLFHATFSSERDGYFSTLETRMSSVPKESLMTMWRSRESNL